MSILQFLNQAWIGNLHGLIAALIGGVSGAIIGFFGSYGIYRKRRRDKTKSIKCALKAEIEQMDYLGKLPEDWESAGYVPPEDKIPAELIPPPEHISTTVYKASTSEIGYLSPDETQKIVEFFGMISYLKSLMALIREENPDSMHPHKALYGLLKKYSGMREDLIQMLDGDLEPNEVEPTSVIQKLDGRVVTTEESDTVTADEIRNRIAEEG